MGRTSRHRNFSCLPGAAFPAFHPVVSDGNHGQSERHYLVTGSGLSNHLDSLCETWLLMGFFKSIPRDLEEAAMVDGYSRFASFLRVVLPLSLSGVIAVIVFTFTLTLHEFVYAMTFISASAQRTISVGVPIELVRGDVFFWQSLLAAAVLVAIPVGIIYNIFLDRLVAGFTMGAVKG
jgi:ABC-type glycerol-3-phosphate transport system permease component